MNPVIPRSEYPSPFDRLSSPRVPRPDMSIKCLERAASIPTVVQDAKVLLDMVAQKIACHALIRDFFADAHCLGVLRKRQRTRLMHDMVLRDS